MRDALAPAAVLFNARGDYLLNLPTLRALSSLWPERLRVVCRQGAWRTFFPYLGVAGVREPPTRCLGREYAFDADDLAAKLAGCDLLLSLNPWHGSSLDRLLDRLAPERSVGFHPSFAAPLPLDFSKHSAELAFDVARAVDRSLAIDRFAEAPVLLEGSEEFARDLIRRAGPGHRIVVVHDDTKSEKRWPPERFAAVLDELLENEPSWLVLDVGERNLGLDVAIEGDRVIPCGQLPLSVAVALVGEADLFIGVDSCFLHAADLYRVPAVGLFGPTEPTEFGVRFGPHRHVRGGSEMTGITEAMVLDAVHSLQDEVASAPPTGQRTATERPAQFRAQ